MSNNLSSTDTRQARWARFRFSVIGSLLSAPPEPGALQKALLELAKRQWRHPNTGELVQFAKSTIERWFYQAAKAQDPVSALRTKRRTDADKTRRLSIPLKQEIQQQYKEHPSWSYQLHVDNLKVIVNNAPQLGDMPSYNTVRRYMKANNLCKIRRLKRRPTEGVLLAAHRLETREVRSFEMDHVHALWHLDFHQGSLKILGSDGQWYKTLLLCFMDDRSRLICHAQWYLDETAETLVHGLMQAIQKRGLPRALMTDNGSAMTSSEFTQGLERLGIVHETTLPYSPYQNGKQETLWGQVEGRLLAMLEGEQELTLSLLNQATSAWVELEYHRTRHSELKCTPMDRYLQGPDVGRASPDTRTLRRAFCTQVHRKQRKSDGTFSLQGKRFEVPSQYRHVETLCIRYASWDLSHVLLIDPHSDSCLSTLYPQDKSANAQGQRRTLPQHAQTTHPSAANQASGIAPLLKELMAQFAATGLPPAYIPKEPHHD
jgi:putative transposase